MRYELRSCYAAVAFGRRKGLFGEGEDVGFTEAKPVLGRRILVNDENAFAVIIRVCRRELYSAITLVRHNEDVAHARSFLKCCGFLRSS